MLNRALCTAVTALSVAQLLKVPVHYLRTGRWDWSRWKEPGGMPSSHSASVAALSTFVALKRGLRSVDFAISSIFGMIVMYDAMGVRRHAGEIAAEVNGLQAEVDRLAHRHPGEFHQERRRHLKEVLGHMPQEVAAGTLLGVAIGAASAALDSRGR